MRALFLNGYFRLPDNFTGNLSDALEMCAKYLRENPIVKADVKDGSEEKQAYDKSQKFLYPAFVEAVLERNKSFKAIHALFETDEKGGFTKRIDE